VASYGQFCPIAQAAEILTERWTPIVLRELLLGSRRFNEIQNGAPTMSSSLLVKRLRTLEATGVIEHRDGEYVLTRAGEELRPLIEQMAVWGERWVRREVSREDADAALLMWAVRRSVRIEGERVVLHFRFTDAPQHKRCWWLVVEHGEADLCLKDPGFGVDLTVLSEPQALASVWLGDLTLAEALRRREIRLVGPEHHVRAFPRWFGLSSVAGIEPASPRRAPRRPPRGRRTPSAHPSSP
jgi:DNA-binding HxlR family transcriptional regulator